MPNPVGRPPWTTSEQFAYLEKFLPDLDDEKVTNGLTQLYARITRDFALRWEPPVVEKDRQLAENEEDLKKLSYERRARVSPPFFVLQSTSTDRHCDSKFPNGSKSSTKPPPLPLSPSPFST